MRFTLGVCNIFTYEILHFWEYRYTGNLPLSFLPENLFFGWLEKEKTLKETVSHAWSNSALGCTIRKFAFAALEKDVADNTEKFLVTVKDDAVIPDIFTCPLTHEVLHIVQRHEHAANHEGCFCRLPCACCARVRACSCAPWTLFPAQP
jgi:hypothetical protein